MGFTAGFVHDGHLNSTIAHAYVASMGCVCVCVSHRCFTSLLTCSRENPAASLNCRTLLNPLIPIEISIFPKGAV